MLPARLRSSDTVILLCGLAAVATSIVLLDVADARIFFAFALLVSASEMFEVTLPNGMPFTLGLAPGLGFALYGHHSLAETIAAFATGLAAAALMRIIVREKIRFTDAAVQLLALTGAAVVHVAFQQVEALQITTTEPDPSVLSINFGALLLTSVAMFAAVVFIETGLYSLRRARAEQLPLRPLIAASLRSTAALHLAILSVGALLALSYPTLKYWSFPLFLAPLWATHYAYRQFAQIKTTYLQTIRALSKVPEIAGYSARGHSKRVADLATAIAREMAVPEHEVNEVEYAALLHDIGRISLSEPNDEASPEHLATVGAMIVRETGHFPSVADMIQQQHVAYRRRGEDTDRDLSVGARAIKVASAYDDLTKYGALGNAPRDALDRLYLGMAFDYDPEVIKALTRVLEKRGVI